jgi:hypothetical protein
MWFFKKKSKAVTTVQTEPLRETIVNPTTINEPPKCPYCRYEFDKPLTRKRTCPKCKETIILRSIEGQSRKELFTVEQNEKIERDLHFTRIAENFEKVLRADGLYDSQLVIHQQEWEEKTGGNRPVLDYFWSTLNQLVKSIPKGSGSDRIANVYSLMAEIAKYEGRSTIIYEKEYNAWSMIGSIDEYGIRCKIEVLTAPDSCPECLKLKGRLFTEKEFFKEKPIPVENCSHNSGCRCCTTIVLNE